jgi:hypothetical protein
MQGIYLNKRIEDVNGCESRMVAGALPSMKDMRTSVMEMRHNDTAMMANVCRITDHRSAIARWYTEIKLNGELESWDEHRRTARRGSFSPLSCEAAASVPRTGPH